MTTVHLIDATGRERTIDAPPGRSLMMAAIDAGIAEIYGDCGGCLSCATCHVYIDDAWIARLPPPGGDENSMLEMTAAERRPGSRLCCQITVDPALEGLVVHLPASQY